MVIINNCDKMSRRRERLYSQRGESINMSHPGYIFISQIAKILRAKVWLSDFDMGLGILIFTPSSCPPSK